MPWRGGFSLLHSMAVSFVALALMAAPNAKGADCTNAAARYTAAVTQVMEALRRFEGCVASSNRRNDCADAFEALDSAHDDFVDAVDDLKTCP